jgi:hypothetical protein
MNTKTDILSIDNVFNPIKKPSNANKPLVNCN